MVKFKLNEEFKLNLVRRSPNYEGEMSQSSCHPALVQMR